MSKTKQTLVIDREIWLRGDEDGSMLLDGTGKRCCVGIYLHSCGVADDLMDGTPDVAMLVEMHGDEVLPERARWLLDDEGRDVLGKIQLYRDNDSDTLEGWEREEVIAEKFADYGVTVTFVN